MSPIDDRTSSKEVPVSAHASVFTDLYGRAWSQRPDELVRNEIRKVGVSEDDYWEIERMLTDRKWDELEEYLLRLKSKRESGDDLKRIEEARKVILRQINEQRSDELL
jgi:hypothetical protein